MTRTSIIVADSAHARFFALQIPEEPLADGGAQLVEMRDLVNPDAEIPERLQFGDRAGRAHASPEGAAHALDGGRERHRQELGRRWARRLLDEGERFVRHERSTRLLLIAELRVLGALRELRVRERLGDIEIVELGENLVLHPVAQIQSILASRGLVPAAAAPEVGVFRPRGQPPVER
jgi:protein required for attachment to host cells